VLNAAAIKIEAYDIHRPRHTINKANKAHSLYCYVKKCFGFEKLLLRACRSRAEELKRWQSKLGRNCIVINR